MVSKSLNYDDNCKFFLLQLINVKSLHILAIILASMLTVGMPAVLIWSLISSGECKYSHDSLLVMFLVFTKSFGK